MDVYSGVGLLGLRDAEVKWELVTKDFGLGPALVADDALFMSAMGKVASVNLATGRLNWSRGGLRRDGLYAGFGAPVVRDAVVEFPDAGTESVLVVDRENGAIVSGAPPSVQEWLRDRKAP